MMDRGEPLLVQFHHGELQSIERRALLSGENLIAIGNGHPDLWELMQVERAELVGEGTYALSMRLRGQAGTEWLIPDAWPVGSYVVVLDQALHQIALAPSLRGIERHYRIGLAETGYDEDDVLHDARAFQGNGLRPYSVCALKTATDDTHDHHISWIRRTRLNGDNWDGYDVALGEEVELYAIQIRDADQVVKRRAESSLTRWHYDLATRTADNVLAGYWLSVRQISYAFGAGPETRIWVAAE